MLRRIWPANQRCQYPTDGALEARGHKNPFRCRRRRTLLPQRRTVRHQCQSTPPLLSLLSSPSRSNKDALFPASEATLISWCRDGLPCLLLSRHSIQRDCQQVFRKSNSSPGLHHQHQGPPCSLFTYLYCEATRGRQSLIWSVLWTLPCCHALASPSPHCQSQDLSESAPLSSLPTIPSASTS
ncbi:hypothetical protein J3F83DRAFT_659533 [Trichoderma novae-zelandiae]